LDLKLSFPSCFDVDLLNIYNWRPRWGQNSLKTIISSTFAPEISPSMSKNIKDPRQIGEILKELFILRPDGSIDHDMVIALANAANQYSQNQDNYGQR